MAEIGYAYTYNGSSWSWTAIDGFNAGNGNNELKAVSCPSASFCAAVDKVSNAFTYNGSSWSNPRGIDAEWPLASVSCSSATFCIALDKNKGEVLSYNGSSWSTPVWVISGELQSVSCPSSSFCVAGAYGHVATYNGSTWTRSGCIDCAPTGEPNRYYAYTLTSVSCPSSSFCAIVDGWGKALTYDGSSWSAPTDIDGETRLTSVSCAAPSFCVAVDKEGNAFTYNGSSWSAPLSVDSDKELTSVSCPSASFCVAVDWSGRALTYDGSSWSAPATIDPGHALSSVSCPSTLFCVAVDYRGNALTYRASPPLNTSPPAISGNPTQGQTLSEQNGIWTGSPIAYAYQWLRCDSDGSSCIDIAGATAQSYALNDADIGHTIRVQESARNLAGTGGPVVSSATGVVQELQVAIGRATVGRAKARGLIVRVPLGCTGPSGASCEITLVIRIAEKPRRGKLVSSSAVAHKVDSSKRTMTVGKKTVQLKAGHHRFVRITLNTVGRHLLKAHRKLSAGLRVTQAVNSGVAVIASQRITFRAQKRKR